MTSTAKTKAPNGWIGLEGGRLNALVEIASAAGELTLTYFRREGLTVEAKSDQSPVTAADREAEQLVRGLVTERFPDDAVQGEEFADQAGTSRYRWIVDPIDGTKSFVCGVPLYSTLLGIERDGEPFAGAIVIPASDELVVAASGRGCWYRDRAADWVAAAVSDKSTLDAAVFVTSQVDSFAQRGAADVYRALESAAWITRSWGDGYGYLLVATGRADLMVDPVCNAWDVAAILPVITEAGGRFTDWQGTPTTRGGDGVGTNGRLHEAVLERLQGSA